MSISNSEKMQFDCGKNDSRGCFKCDEFSELAAAQFRESNREALAEYVRNEGCDKPVKKLVSVDVNSISMETQEYIIIGGIVAVFLIAGLVVLKCFMDVNICFCFGGKAKPPAAAADDSKAKRKKRKAPESEYDDTTFATTFMTTATDLTETATTTATDTDTETYVPKKKKKK